MNCFQCKTLFWSEAPPTTHRRMDRQRWWIEALRLIFDILHPISQICGHDCLLGPNISITLPTIQWQELHPLKFYMVMSHHTSFTMTGVPHHLSQVGHIWKRGIRCWRCSNNICYEPNNWWRNKSMFIDGASSLQLENMFILSFGHIDRHPCGSKETRNYPLDIMGLTRLVR